MGYAECRSILHPPSPQSRKVVHKDYTAMTRKEVWGRVSEDHTNLPETEHQKVSILGDGKLEVSDGISVLMN